MAARAAQGSYPFRDHPTIAQLKAMTSLDRARAASARSHAAQRAEGLAFARAWRERRAQEEAL